MLLWFQRRGQHVQVQILQPVNGRCELRVLDSDGREHVEEFFDPEQLRQRQEMVCEGLRAEGWQRSGEWLL